jgi:hypothetical protein
VKFIVRYDAPEVRLHIAEQAVVSGLPEWRKMPYCRNGGLFLKSWHLIELDPSGVPASRVCQVCRMRLEAHKVDVTWKSE